MVGQLINVLIKWELKKKKSTALLRLCIVWYAYDTWTSISTS